MLSAELLSSLPMLLFECADPVQAANLFERLIATGDRELAGLLDQNRVLLQHILTIFGQSYWLGETIANHPDIVGILAAKPHADRPLEREDFRRSLERFRSPSTHTDVSTLLASFKRREYIGIAMRDILGFTTLAGTTAELSALADVILEDALREAQSQMEKRFGEPLRTAVHGKTARASILSLGKLGGNELNYSSDLDLLYLYHDEGLYDPAAAREYFTRQFQLLTEILCRTTAEGPVFRIDLRLRPQGREGGIAIGLHQALNYYRHTARDWELQALIKVRHSAGDQALSAEFIDGVQPRVYAENFNFAAIDTALRSREHIHSRRRLRRFQSTDPTDVKLDPGGIRDVEFLVQCLQRTYGGEEKWLRSGGTLFSLQKLHDKGHISGRDFHELTQAYEFLRALEHRLQLQHGQQTHRLPADQKSLSVLWRAMASRMPGDPGTDFRAALREHMRVVSGIYDRIIFSQRRRQKRAGEAAARLPSASSAREMSFEQVLDHIVQDSSELHEIAARSYPIHTRRNLHRFLSSAMTSSERYAALLENPTAVEKAIPLLAESDYLADILVRHPDAIRALDAPVAPEDGVDAHDLYDDLLSGSAESLHSARPVDALRRSYRKFSFAIGARDVIAPRPALQSMRESSALAEAAIGEALKMSGAEDKLAIFALGRLGTGEFDIASDADLIFLRTFDSDEDLARAAAEKVIHALAAYTREGLIFAVDARLRPHGQEGELVITPAHLERYLSDEARPWEALTYTKLRFIAGRKDFSSSILPLVWDKIMAIAARPNFAEAVMEMRTRLEKSNRFSHSFKLARGGFYDIDFMASFLLLRGGSPGSGNTLERLDHICRAGLLPQSQFQRLRDATLLYRTADHVIRLVTGRARPELPSAEHARLGVETLINRILSRSESADLQQTLDATATDVRAIFQEIFATNGNVA